MRDRHAAHRLGLDAESACAEYLRARGYEILAERLRTKAGEIDLLARDGDTLVVVEVKARESRDACLFSVTPAKRKRLVAAAWALLAEPGEIAGLAADHAPNIRFDMMAVAPDGEPLHLQDAWREE